MCAHMHSVNYFQEEINLRKTIFDLDSSTEIFNNLWKGFTENGYDSKTNKNTLVHCEKVATYKL
jgi:hypothetical protein